jgi:colicin import membrane protein
MARPGITEQEVIDAAEALTQAGEAVTVAAVREVIGSGSFSTINTFLTKWKDSAGNRKADGVPEMPESVGRAMRQLWGAAWKEAQDGLRIERDALEAARRDMERERRDMAQEIARLETQTEGQGEEIRQQTAALAEKEAALGTAHTTNQNLMLENARLDERVKASEKDRDNLTQTNAALSARLDHAAQTLKQQEAAQADLTARHVRLEEKTAQLEKTLTEKTRHAATLEKQLEETKAEANRQAEAQRQALDAAQQTLKAREVEQARLEERATAAESLAAELRAELDKLHVHFKELASQTGPAPQRPAGTAKTKKKPDSSEPS